MIQTLLSLFGLFLGGVIFTWAIRAPYREKVRANIGMPVGAIIMLGFFGGGLSYALAWNTHNWIQDVRTGTTWSIGDISADASAQIDHIVPNNVEWTVADSPDDAACTLEWTPGKSVWSTLGDGHSYRIEVIGRATQPDFRYLVKASGSSGAGLDPTCTVRFLVTEANLANLKADWKKSMRIINNPTKFKSVAREVASVKPVH